MKIQLASKTISIVAGLLAIGGLLSYLKAEDNTKALALNVTLICSTVAVTNEALSKHYQNIANDQLQPLIKEAESIVKKAESESLKNTTLAQEFKRLNEVQKVMTAEKISVINNLNEQLTAERATTKALLDKTNAAIKKLESDIETLTQQRITDFQESKDAILQEMHSRVNNYLGNLLSSIETNINFPKYIDIRDKLTVFKNKVDEEIKTITAITQDMVRDETVSDLIYDYAQIFDKIMTLRIQWRNLLNTRERLALIELDKRLEQHIPREKAIALTREQSSGHRQQLENIYQNVSEHSNDIAVLRQQITDLIDQIEAKNLEINKLREPMTWRLATREDLRVGNIIINYFQQLGIVLDRAASNYKVFEAVLSFHIDRNSRIHTPQEFNTHSDKLQQLCHTLAPIAFSWNAEDGLLTAHLQLSRKPPKHKDEDISRLWKTADKFSVITAKWESVRITGQSKAGKSPTSENLAVCIMLARKDAGDIKLYNPQHNSRKNHFTIPTVGTTHQESIDEILRLAIEINKQVSDRKVYDLYIFDEIDSTLTNAENAKAVSDGIKEIIKQRSHQNVGVIFTGQNANIRNYPGFDRSDWNNAVNVHIGKNIFDAIENSNEGTPDDKKRLKEQATILMNYCETKNLELGLDADSDPNALRFAIVYQPNKAPYFLQLPDFGEYTYDLLSSVKCPNCDSTNTVKHGKNRRKCNDCKSTFTDSKN